MVGRPSSRWTASLEELGAADCKKRVVLWQRRGGEGGGVVGSVGPSTGGPRINAASFNHQSAQLQPPFTRFRENRAAGKLLFRVYPTKNVSLNEKKN